MRLDTFACPADPEGSTSASPSSAHTYRLLIFKELSLRSSAFFASVIKREANYAMPFGRRQPHSRKKFVSTSKSTLVTLAALMKLKVACSASLPRRREERMQHEQRQTAPRTRIAPAADVSQGGPCLIVAAPLHMGARRKTEQRRESRQRG